MWEQTPLDPAAVPENCFKTCPNGHSAVPIPGTPYALTTDEVCGTFTDPSFGCPWGWVRIIDVADPTNPTIVGEYKIAEDEQSFCGRARDDALTEQFTSYSSHNPTLLPDLALVDWHSGGIQAINLSDPASPAQAGFFLPKPLCGRHRTLPVRRVRLGQRVADMGGHRLASAMVTAFFDPVSRHSSHGGPRWRGAWRA